MDTKVRPVFSVQYRRNSTRVQSIRIKVRTGVGCLTNLLIKAPVTRSSLYFVSILPFIAPKGACTNRVYSVGVLYSEYRRR